MILRWRMIPDAVAALWRSTVTLFRRKPVFVAVFVADQRLETCEGCVFFEPESRQCRVCACFVDAKVTLTEETCPEHFWTT